MPRPWTPVVTIPLSPVKIPGAVCHVHRELRESGGVRRGETSRFPAIRGRSEGPAGARGWARLRYGADSRRFDNEAAVSGEYVEVSIRMKQ